MAKHAQRQIKRSKRDNYDPRFPAAENSNVVDLIPHRMPSVGKFTETRKRVVCKTEAQAHFLLAIKDHVITFGLGPAGTGKTHIPAAYGVELMQAGVIDKIIVTRPMEGGEEEEIGALPGTLQEKFEPWFAPVRAILDKQMGRNAVDCQLKLGNIEVKPLQFLRGATFERAMVILDEAQNTTPKQMELFLSRIGEGCHVVINGDLAQQDTKGISGLRDAIMRLHPLKSDYFAFRVFKDSDIVRHPVVREILQAYRKPLSSEDAQLMRLLEGDVEADTDDQDAR